MHRSIAVFITSLNRLAHVHVPGGGGLGINFGELRQCEVQHSSPIQTAQARQRGSKKRGRPGKRGKKEREDRPNAVTPITLLLRIEHRICQVTIIIYTRWPFLDRPSAPVRTAQNRWRGSRVK